MPSTVKRSFTKALTWQASGILFIFAMSLFLTGNVWSTLKITLLYATIKIPLYFIHERLWKRVSWGKKKS